MIGKNEDFDHYTKEQVVDLLIVVQHNLRVFKGNIKVVESKNKDLQEIIDKKTYIENKKPKWYFQLN